MGIDAAITLFIIRDLVLDFGIHEGLGTNTPSRKTMLKALREWEPFLNFPSRIFNFSSKGRSRDRKLEISEE